MSFLRIKLGAPALAWLLSLSLTGCAAGPDHATPKPAPWSRRGESVVEVTTICPSIVYELRYATTRNFTGRQIYPRNARCLLRKSVAQRLVRVQAELQQQGYGLKIWDAYRPNWAHDLLWQSAPNPEFIAAPSWGGSYHTWGSAVDVTLVDLHGRELKMPTDFDDFTDAAKSEYRGGDPQVAARVLTLRIAMANAGFKGVRDEWWHYAAEDSNQFAPLKMPLEKGGKK